MPDNNIFSFIANGARVKIHYHHCLQIVVSLNAAYDCTIEGEDIKDNRGFIINQRVRHSCTAPQSQVLVVKINADCHLGQVLKQLLDGRQYIDLKTILPAGYFNSILPQDYEQLSPELREFYVNDFLDKILRNYGRSYIPAAAQDERIQAALTYIEENISERLTLKQIASVMYLSLERARHLFQEQLGSPFVQYVLWLRIRRILEAAKNDNINLANACIRYGFTDQSHFTRVFGRLYGISPKGFVDRVLLV